MTRDTTTATRRFDISRLPLRAPAEPPSPIQPLLDLIRSVRKYLDAVAA